MTRDSEKMLCCLYKEYLQRIKAGESKTDSKFFKAEYFSNDEVLSKWHPDDTASTRNSLGKLGLLKIHISGNFEFTDSGIEFMETRFKSDIEKVANHLAELLIGVASNFTP